MSFRRWAALLIVLLSCVIVPASVAARAATPNVVAERYEVTIDLRSDGSLDIVERITLNVGSKPITWFERRVPDRRTDGLTNVIAMIDGREAPPLANGVGIRLRNRQGIDARWEFAPIANRERTFELRYRAARVLAREPAGVRLRWNALPTQRIYPIGAARVVLRAPAGTLAVAMSAEGGDMQPATSWADGLTVTRSSLGVNDGIALDVTFSAATIRPAEPAWGALLERQRKLAPAFIAGGLVTIVVGIGTLLMIRIRTHRQVNLTDVARSPAEESDASPAVAAALLNRGQTAGWLPLQAAFFRLVRDGQLVVEKTGEKRWFKGASFTVTLGAAGVLMPHEQWIIDTVSGDAGTVDLRKLTTKLMRRQREFHRTLREEMTTMGGLDGDRSSTAQALTVAGIVLLVFSLVSAGAVAALLIESLGPALLAMPAGLFVDAIAFLIGGSAMSRLSESGERSAARWRARVTECRQMMRARGEGASLSDFERWLPLEIGAGNGARWLKAFDVQLRAAGTDLAWLKRMGTAEDARAAIVMIIAISGASHGGSGGSGAGAGGGSSGAG